MGKLFKVLGTLIAVLVLLVVAAVVILPMVVDPNDYKEEIVSAVQEQTGRDLKIEGDLKLSVFPWLGIEIGALELSNAKGFGDKPFAAVGHAAVRVKLMPLLSKQLEVDTVGLEGLRLNLAKTKDGKTNWDDLAKGKAGEDKVETSGPGEGMASLSIGGVDISNARISWDDKSSGQLFEVENFNLKSGAIAPGRPVGLEMSFALQSKEPQAKANLNLTGTVSVDEDKGVIDVSGLKVVVDAEGEALQGGALHAELETALSMALNGDSMNLKGLKVSAGDLNLSGDLVGSNLTTKPAFNGSLALAQFNLRNWMVSQKMELPPMADDAALTKVAASVGLSAQGDVTRFENLAIDMDDTKITGSASLKGQAIGFNLNVDAIDADRYLPPASEGEQEQVQSKATGDEPLFPVETLRSLNINGVLKIGRLTIQKLLAEQVEVSVKASGGKLNINQKIDKFYEGQFTGKVDLNVAGKTPVMQVEKSLNGMNAGPLLKDLTGEDKLTGKGQFNAKLSAQGNSMNAVKKSLGGNLNFSFADGAVKGFNLAETIREAKAKFQGESVPKSDAPPQTDFSELSGSGVITNGVLNNQDLLAKSPFLRVTGAGAVNIVSETLDYKIKPVIVSTAKGQGGEGLDELKGVPVPVHLTGPYASPEWSIDWGQVLAGTQKAKIEEKKEEVKTKLQEKLGDKLKGFLR